MGIQLAKKLLALRVIATASRDASIDCCKKLGADLVINHRNPYAEELKKVGVEQVDFVVNCIDLDKNFDQLCEVLAPFGKIGAITTAGPVDMSKLFFPKAGSLCWEL